MSKDTGKTYQMVQLGKEIDVLKKRIVKLQDRVDYLSQENSRLREMLSVYETSRDSLNKENRDLIRRLSKELIRK
jgi:regulator of replication initiation timing